VLYTCSLFREIRLWSCERRLSLSRTGLNLGWKNVEPPVIDERVPREATSIYDSGKRKVLRPIPHSAQSSAVLRYHPSGVKRDRSLSVL